MRIPALFSGNKTQNTMPTFSKSFAPVNLPLFISAVSRVSTFEKKIVFAIDSFTDDQVNFYVTVVYNELSDLIDLFIAYGVEIEKNKQ